LERKKNAGYEGSTGLADRDQGFFSKVIVGLRGGRLAGYGSAPLKGKLENARLLALKRGKSLLSPRRVHRGDEGGVFWGKMEPRSHAKSSKGPTIDRSEERIKIRRI